MYPDFATGNGICTCCKGCAQSRLVVGATVYGTCLTGSEYFTFTAKASRRYASCKGSLKYLVRVQPTAEAADPYTLQIALPAGTHYVGSKAMDLKDPPTIAMSGTDGTTLVTWTNMSPKNTKTNRLQAGTFSVQLRVRKVTKGTKLAFNGAVYQLNQLSGTGLECGNAANLVTMRDSYIRIEEGGLRTRSVGSTSSRPVHTSHRLWSSKQA